MYILLQRSQRAKNEENILPLILQTKNYYRQVLYKSSIASGTPILHLVSVT